MTKAEADDLATRIRDKCPDLTAKVIRILPDFIDPPKDGDNGWDVLIQVRNTERRGG
jgi:hypothetical protein